MPGPAGRLHLRAATSASSSSLENSEPHPVQRPQVGKVCDRGYARTAEGLGGTGLRMMVFVGKDHLPCGILAAPR
jgi:hypothetical protein